LAAVVKEKKNQWDGLIQEWGEISTRIERAIEGLNDHELDARGGPEGWSIRETVHHLVEANQIASNIVIAAMANTGGIYDWSWVNPDRSWMRRTGYDKAPVEPALATLKALSEHLKELLKTSPDAGACEIQLLDAVGAEPRTVTVVEVLQEEVNHAQEHLKEIIGNS
jgi:hypothetical protein